MENLQLSNSMLQKAIVFYSQTGWEKNNFDNQVKGHRRNNGSESARGPSSCPEDEKLRGRAPAAFS